MPAAYTSAQKKAIADFVAVTASDRSTAARVRLNLLLEHPQYFQESASCLEGWVDFGSMDWL